MTNAFTSSFAKYVSPGDVIEASVDGFDIEAQIVGDIGSDTPEERDDGFWPSKDPKSAGYVEPKDFDKATEHAEAVMQAWKNNEWFYCGVVLSVTKNGILLDNHAASLWGIECNYPGSDNSYLTEVANELLDEAISSAKRTLQKLTA